MAGEMEVTNQTGRPHNLDSIPDGLDQALRDYMFSGVNGGVPTPEQAFGLVGSLDGQIGQPGQLQDQPAPLEDRLAQVPNADELMALKTELQQLRSQIGTTENEKGILRKRTEEATTALNEALLQQKMLADRMQELLTAQPQFNQPQFPAPGYPQGYSYQPPVDPFAALNDDEVVQGRQIKQLINETLTPVLAHLGQRAQASEQRAIQLEQQMLATRKREAGLGFMDEQRILNEQPWIKSLPGDQAKVEATLGFWRARQAAQAATNVGNNDAQQAAQPASQQPVAMATRRLTSVEGNQPSPAAELASQATPMDRVWAEWQETLKIPLGTGKREAAQRALLMRHGVQPVNDWR